MTQAIHRKRKDSKTLGKQWSWHTLWQKVLDFSLKTQNKQIIVQWVQQLKQRLAWPLFILPSVSLLVQMTNAVVFEYTVTYMILSSQKITEEGTAKFFSQKEAITSQTSFNFTQCWLKHYHLLLLQVVPATFLPAVLPAAFKTVPSHQGGAYL